MKKHIGLALTAAAFLSAAIPCAAGDLRLSMANGRVTLLARDVTVREILAEWARVGQARIINAEKIAGTPVTLELQDVPEAQALDTVLRSAAGYVMVPRVAGAPGVSRYDRIMILASSRPPTTTTATTAQPFTGRTPQTPIPQVATSDDDDEQPNANGNMMPQPIFPQPQNGQAMPGPQQLPPPQGVQTGQPLNQPMTAPRPGIMPAPPPTAAPPNPYLVQPPTQQPGATPGPQTVPGPPPPPRRPGGGGQ